MSSNITDQQQFSARMYVYVYELICHVLGMTYCVVIGCGLAFAL